MRRLSYLRQAAWILVGARSQPVPSAPWNDPAASPRDITRRAGTATSSRRKNVLYPLSNFRCTESKGGMAGWLWLPPFALFPCLRHVSYCNDHTINDRTVIVWLLHRDCLFIGVALNRVRRTWTVHWFPGPMWLLWYVDRR